MGADNWSAARMLPGKSSRSSPLLSTVRAVNWGSTGRPTLIRNGAVRIRDGVAEPLPPLLLTGRELSEADIQALLDAQPDVLPIEAISSRWGPLISLGREIGLAVGYVDNLYVSPAGELTLVEAKLWRNSEARREVVGQIIDYAAALATMSYEELDEAVQSSTPGPPIWARVKQSVHAPPEGYEPIFIDTVTRNLRTGRFLLLIVGDGVRSNLHSIADLLGRHPALAFHLELVELRVHELPGGTDLLVVPTLVGRTEEVTRAVVEIHNPDRGEISVSVELPTPPPEPATRLQSLEEFATQAAEQIEPARADAILDVAKWWRDNRDQQVKLNKASISLYARRLSQTISVLTIYTNGEAVGSVAPMAKTNNLCNENEAIADFQAAGFSGGPDYPTLDFDPTIEDERQRILGLLDWAAEVAGRAAAPD